jgi:hypothetical protein
MERKERETKIYFRKGEADFFLFSFLSEGLERNKNTKMERSDLREREMRLSSCFWFLFCNRQERKKNGKANTVMERREKKQKAKKRKFLSLKKQ